MCSLKTFKKKKQTKTKLAKQESNSNIECIPHTTVICWWWTKRPNVEMWTLNCSRSRFSSVGRASGSQILWETKFKSRQPHLCNSMWGQDQLRAGRQEVGKCSTKGGSRGMYITFASAMRIRQPTLTLHVWKPRGEVTRNSKQGYQWPQKRTCVHQKL